VLSLSRGDHIRWTNRQDNNDTCEGTLLNCELFGDEKAEITIGLNKDYEETFTVAAFYDEIKKLQSVHGPRKQHGLCGCCIERPEDTWQVRIPLN